MAAAMRADQRRPRNVPFINLSPRMSVVRRRSNPIQAAGASSRFSLLSGGFAPPAFEEARMNGFLPVPGGAGAG